MALLNTGFEDAGVLPGEAAHWTLTTSTNLEVIAGFGANPVDAWEDFERWHRPIRSLDDVQVVLAFFDGAVDGREAFETGWNNAVYLKELPPSQLAAGVFGDGDVENCERGWRNVPYLRDWAQTTSQAAAFDDEARETFERRWRDNDRYARTWDAVQASAALFDARAQPIEKFEGAWTHTTTM